MPRRRVVVAVAAAVLAVTGGTAAAALSGAAPASTEAVRVSRAAPVDVSPAPAPSATIEPHPGLEGYRVARAVADMPPPVRVRVPALGVDSPLDGLGQAPDRTVEVPDDPTRAGWYELGPRPGQSGPAVVLGHVDGQGRPGVFFRLHELEVGAVVVVDRADGTEVRFRVTRLERMPKTAFPTREVYLPTAGPELRLVTCGGSFDAATGHYRDNVIAYAELAA